MYRKAIILSIILLITISGLVTGISIVLQPGQTKLGYSLIIGSALVGAAATISGIKDGIDIFEKCLLDKKRRSLDIPKNIALDILSQLYTYGNNGIEHDLFISYLLRTYNFRRNECTSIYEELENKGYVIQQSGIVRITKLGNKYINKK